jgi:hypothetical protein
MGEETVKIMVPPKESDLTQEQPPISDNGLTTTGNDMIRRLPMVQTSSRTSPITSLDVKRTFLRSLARWSPLLAATLSLGLIVALAAPIPRDVSSSGPTGVAGNGSSRATSTSGSGYSSGPSGSKGISGKGLHGTQVSSSAGGFSSGAGGSSGESSAAPVGASGVTVTGEHCGPGVKQFNWSAYAPPCVPAFHGNNGGDTSKGVTGKTITLTFAEPSQSTMQLVDTFAGYASINVPAYVSDMETYIKYFNTQFELYGRQVVLKPFQAQGDFLLEDAGEDLSGAEADAETAASIPAFADVTFPLLTSAYYLQDLAENHVIGTGGLAEPDSWFEQYAPYEFSEAPTGTSAAYGFGHMICARMAGMPAIFSPQYSEDTRVFGLITPETPEYERIAQDVMNTMTNTCGQKVKVWEQYTLGSLQTYQSQAVSIVAKMKSEGVTTVICGCDPIFPIEVSQAAAQQDYDPEWVAIGWEDPITQEYNQSEWAHAISEEGQTPPMTSLHAYQVFLKASGGKPPAEQYFYVAYYTLLMVYDALQLAGPNLNPQTFEQGWFSMPETPEGQDGIWSGGNGAWSLANVTTGLGWWDPNAESYADGKAGAWEDCAGGKLYYFNNPNGWGTPHTQLRCFGRS